MTKFYYLQLLKHQINSFLHISYFLHWNYFLSVSDEILASWADPVWAAAGSLLNIETTTHKYLNIESRHLKYIRIFRWFLRQKFLDVFLKILDWSNCKYKISDKNNYYVLYHNLCKFFFCQQIKTGPQASFKNKDSP